MSSVPSRPYAAYHRPHRPPRVEIAVGISAVLVLALVASAILSGLDIKGPTGVVVMLGLPVIGLVALATAALLRAVDHDPAKRRRHLLQAGVAAGIAVLGWLLVVEALLFAGAAPAAAAVSAVVCIPTTTFGLWFLRRLDRNEKEPWRLMLVAAAWGGLVATSLALWANTFISRAATGALVPGPGVDVVTAYSAGFFEEIGKGLAVLLLYLVMRHEFDDVVDGIVYGAAVGIGFNYMESILYMSHIYALVGGGPAGVAGATIQWYNRQVLGLFFGHASYTALTGAGIGLARQLHSNRAKVLAIASGWLGAIAAHFAWDAWLQFFPTGTGAIVLLSMHVRVLLMDGPFTAIVVLLLYMGAKAEGAAIERHLRLEAGLGRGTIVPSEVAVLVDPWRRAAARWRTFARLGFRAYRQVGRLQQAQLELAMERWHRERQEIDEPLEAEEALRSRVLALRTTG